MLEEKVTLNLSSTVRESFSFSGQYLAHLTCQGINKMVMQIYATHYDCRDSVYRHMLIYIRIVVSYLPSQPQYTG